MADILKRFGPVALDQIKNGKNRNLNIVHERLIGRVYEAPEDYKPFDPADIAVCESQYQHYDTFSRYKRK